VVAAFVDYGRRSIFVRLSVQFFPFGVVSRVSLRRFERLGREAVIRAENFGKCGERGMT
jgi:hypothetical protein